MTGLEVFKQSTLIMIQLRGEHSTVELKTLVKLLDKAIEMDND